MAHWTTLAVLLHATVSYSFLCKTSNYQSGARRREVIALTAANGVANETFFAEIPQLKAFDVSDDELLRGSEVVRIHIESHSPLGCTIEESLGPSQHVFVSKVVPESNSAKAGLKIGDVIVQVTSTTGEVMEDVSSLGIDKIRGLISARPKTEALDLTVARNSKVIEEHEEAIVNICGNEDVLDIEADQCVLDYLAGGYALDGDSNQVDNATTDTEEENDDTANEPDEDLVGNLYDMWAEDLPTMESAPELEETPAPKEKAKPWSSRSSPSGTFVRDPATGEMKNIDD